jgi:hypothetical protein
LIAQSGDEIFYTKALSTSLDYFGIIFIANDNYMSPRPKTLSNSSIIDAIIKRLSKEKRGNRGNMGNIGRFFIKKRSILGTVPIFVSTKMGLSLLPQTTQDVFQLTQKFLQAPILSLIFSSIF